MKNKRKFHTLPLVSTILILFLILVSSTSSAATAEIASPTITETQISHSGTSAASSVYGNKIVWLDWRNGENNADIYMYDLSISQETQISYNGRVGGPNAIYGDKIVWGDSRNVQDNPDIYMYDLSTSREAQISHSGYAYIPKIHDNRIVWMDNSDAKVDIHVYDLSTSQEIQITHSGSAESPSIYGDKIVYVDYHEGVITSNVYMYDLSTSQETQISHSGIVANPVIYGNKIVWEDMRNGENNADIYMYDLSTSQETQITTNESYQGNPAIYDNKIVWQDNRNGQDNWDIYMYDLSTSQEIQITTNGSQQDSPAIYGNMIVWTDWRSGNPDIYMGIVSEEEPESDLPVANFSINVTNGYAPLAVQFNDSSENATGLNWDFEYDGKIDSTEANPVYIYSAPGTYTVNLTATNENGTSSKLGTITVLEQTLPPVANFTSNVTQGFAPLSVQFTDLSENATEWKWDFGDRKYSTEQNPVHTYNKAGKYTVSLTVKNANGMDVEKKAKYITVSSLKGKKS